MIDYCIKIPILRIKSLEEFKDNDFQPLYTDEVSLSNRNKPDRWFLIDYLCNCKHTDRGYKNIEGNTLTEENIIYLYGDKYHTNKSKHQLDENIFVIQNLIKTTSKKNKEEYKYLLVKLLNILRFARYNYMIFPKNVFNDINSFKKFMKDYFNITVS